MTFSTNAQLELASNFVNNTGLHVFLTGKAGTGKTTFLHQLRKTTLKRMVVTAPTGVAAINAGGVTIHSFFQLPFGPQIPEDHSQMAQGSFTGYKNDEKARGAASRLQKMTREKINLIRSLDLLVIDEISMVRADLLDAIDAVLRRYRQPNQPFGGVQLLMIGDLQQLAPVAREEEWELLRNYYDSVFFFSSRALQKTTYISIELTEIFRQQDAAFIDLLNAVRENRLNEELFDTLNRRYLPGFSPADDEGYITLTSHNAQSQDINRKKLQKIKGKAKIFKAEVTGDFPEISYPTEAELELKMGAQVMFVKNDPSPSKTFYNGLIGTLKHIEDEKLYIRCRESEQDIEVGPLEWSNTRYSIDENTKEITETIIGTFKQYPLKLAWAITIHKSQGLTFDKVIIDAQAAFSHGQVYVALSRCRTLEGMVLSSTIERRSVRHDNNVNQFIQNIKEKPVDEQEYEQAKEMYQQNLLIELFDFSPLHKRLSYLQRLLAEHKNSIDSVSAGIADQILAEIRPKLLEVGDKFIRQLRHIFTQTTNSETEVKLSERVQKAVAYFRPILLEAIEKLRFEPETDNTESRKSISEAQQKLWSDFHVAEQCLKAAENGFSASKFIETRAKASLDQLAKDIKSRVLTKESTGNNALYKILRLWRDAVAEENYLRPDEVLSWKSMLEISRSLPQNIVQLKAIKGIGKKKITLYGNEILDLISGITGLEADMTYHPASHKTEKKSTEIISFELYTSGKSIDEIAEERNLAANTIMGHMAQCVQKGFVPVLDFITKEKIDYIGEYFLETHDTSLKRAKEVLGEDYSYGDLKLVLSHLIYSGQLNTD